MKIFHWNQAVTSHAARDRAELGYRAPSEKLSFFFSSMVLL